MPKGRPKLTEHRTQEVRVRTTRNEQDQLVAAAKTAGVPLARWARESLLIVANNTAPDTEE